MKDYLHTLLLTTSLMFSAFLQGQNVPNGTFETWDTDIDSNVNPRYWATMNSYPVISAFREDAACNDNYALRLKPIESSGFSIPGVVTCDFAYTQRPTTLSGNYRSNIPSGEQALVYVMFYNQGNVIASPNDCTFKITATQGTCTQFSINISYQNSSTPDSATIVIVSGNLTSPDTATEIVLDNLTFGFGTTGVSKSSLLSSNLNIFPNPANQNVNIAFNVLNSSNVEIEICDVAGKTVSTFFSGMLPTGKHEIPLDISELAEGSYFVRLRSGALVSSSRLQVLRGN